MRKRILTIVISIILVNLALITPALGAGIISKGVITGRNVNLRLNPDLSAARVTVLKLGQEVTVLDQTSDWYKISLNSGLSGWVYNQFLAKRRPLGSSRGGFPQILEVAAFAKHFLGLRYVYGGAAPSGFDCSGFTMFVYKQFGYLLPHNAAAQRKMGVEVNRDELMPGDLLFFMTRGAGRISHVGIYLGAGQFIHASSQYREIKISDLNVEYYDARFAGAQRILALQNEESESSRVDETSQGEKARELGETRSYDSNARLRAPTFFLRGNDSNHCLASVFGHKIKPSSNLESFKLLNLKNS